MSKYGNRPARRDGYRFDSQAELRRYEQLTLLQSAGEIDGLQVHPRYTIIDALMVGTKREPPIVYEADFGYWQAGQLIVEDVKGAWTPVFKIKRRLFLARYRDVNFRILDAAEV